MPHPPQSMQCLPLDLLCVVVDHLPLRGWWPLRGVSRGWKRFVELGYSPTVKSLCFIDLFRERGCGNAVLDTSVFIHQESVLLAARFAMGISTLFRHQHHTYFTETAVVAVTHHCRNVLHLSFDTCPSVTSDIIGDLAPMYVNLGSLCLRCARTGKIHEKTYPESCRWVASGCHCSWLGSMMLPSHLGPSAFSSGTASAWTTAPCS